ncbi:MAG: alpha/beta fold hydrolase [Gammaproteobacteria bacterium]
MTNTARLVLIHGFTGHRESWSELLECFPEGSHAAIRVSLVGHLGENEVLQMMPRTFTEEIVRLGDLIESAGGKGSHLVGYSLGARLALGLLVKNPGLFARATLIAAHPGLDTCEEKKERARADEHWIHLLERKGIAPFVRAWERQPLFATQAALSLDRLARQRAQRLRHRPLGLAHALRTLGLAGMPSYWSTLPELHIPVHLVVGGRDDKFVQIAERMQPLLLEGWLTVVEGAGHNVVLERPQELARLLIN